MATEARRPSASQRLAQAHVAGRSRLGRAEVHALIARLLTGDPRAYLGLERFVGLTRAEVLEAARTRWGFVDDGAAARIDPEQTWAAAATAAARIVDVSSRGGRIAFATARPASLLPLHQRAARLAARAGGRLATAREAGALPGVPTQRLWWLDGVAVLTDGSALLAAVGPGPADELMFEIGRPDLLVGDDVFAAAGVRAGAETVALGDLDALALGVAAARGAPVTLVPLVVGRPPEAYAPLAELLTDAAAHLVTPAT